MKARTAGESKLWENRGVSCLGSFCSGESSCGPFHNPMTSFQFFDVEPQGGTNVFRVHCLDIIVCWRAAVFLAAPCVLTTAWLHAYADTFGEEITLDNLRPLK